jgi:hypothetical protein
MAMNSQGWFAGHRQIGGSCIEWPAAHAIPEISSSQCGRNEAYISSIVN